MDWFLYDNGLCHERLNKLLVHQLIYLTCARLHISYKKHVKLFFKVFSQGKSLLLLPGDMGGRGYNKKSD